MGNKAEAQRLLLGALNHDPKLRLISVKYSGASGKREQKTVWKEGLRSTLTTKPCWKPETSARETVDRSLRLLGGVILCYIFNSWLHTFDGCYRPKCH